MKSHAESLSSADRRSSLRSPVQVRVSARNGASRLEATTADLSHGGAAIEFSDQAPGVGSDIDLELHIPGAAHPLRVEGEVRWGQGRRCGIRFRDFAQRAGAAILATFLAALPSQVGAKSDVPDFDPNNFTVDLNQYPGSQSPDENAVMQAFEQQFSAFDDCVYRAKGNSNKRIEGLAEMKVLLNPHGKSPLAVRSLVPEKLKTSKKGNRLHECLRSAVAQAPYPNFDGPPVVVEFEFEIDPGSDIVDE